jgi:signal transduction histidine kinase
MDALLGNVFAHTPEGCAMAVRLDRRPGGGAVLAVADEGPGLPDPRAMGRGNSGSGSTGLGLDIVRRVATGAAGTVRFGRTSTAGGALVTVELGFQRPDSGYA